jgi:hypothetical protein
MAKNRFRQGLGVVVGAAAGIGHFVFNTIYKEWYKIAIALFIASFFFPPLTALTFAAYGLVALLAFKTILNFSKNVDSKDGRVVEHTPIAEAMLYGCGITNTIAGEDSIVHPVVDRKVAPVLSGYRLTRPNDSSMQKTIDGFDGISFAKPNSR